MNFLICLININVNTILRNKFKSKENLNITFLNRNLSSVFLLRIESSMNIKHIQTFSNIFKYITSESKHSKEKIPSFCSRM